MLDAHGLPADALQLEITESMLMSDPECALATVTRLSALGVRLSVDDFGTGYSSLANLRRLPISTINLGHDLGLRIIAEGVEDEGTLARLGLLGCDLAQGYHVSRPLAAEAFADWVGVVPELPRAAAA